MPTGYEGIGAMTPPPDWRTGWNEDACITLAIADGGGV